MNRNLKQRAEQISSNANDVEKTIDELIAAIEALEEANETLEGELKEARDRVDELEKN